MSNEVSSFELKPLGECVEVLDRLRRPINNDERRNRQGDIPYYGANGQVGTIDEWIFNEDLVLVAEDGGFFNDPVRPISYRISGKSWVNNHAHVLRPLSNMNVDWLNYSVAFQDIRHMIKGSTLKKLNQKELKKILVPCPPIDDQVRIVARIKGVMERVDEVQGLYKDLTAESKVLPVASKYDLWNECSSAFAMTPLGEAVRSAKNGLYKPKKFHGSGTLLLRMFNIRDGEMDISRSERLETTEKETSDFAVLNGDIIVSRVNSRELVGKSALVHDLTEPAVNEAMIIRLRIDSKKADGRFLSWLMNSPQFLHDLRGRAKHAIGQSSINQSDLLSTLLPLPCLEVQQEMINIKEQFLPLAIQLQDEIVKQGPAMAGLQEAILRKAFAGEL
ncbi:restriction endonuclease subunit S [Desulfuromonas sp.]|uniref:restriction endonuclease subunit S n=1 Tax=Desulfuromonas sp. TaxID=892 RepID=UPI0025BDC6A5|nr:restriction endonuclease subunit S [Desulfuromonas sp.]